MNKYADLGEGIPAAFRLGLATRGNTKPAADDILDAFDCGINYWNWCGHEDGMSQASRELGTRRSEVILTTQISAYDGGRDSMLRSIDNVLTSLKTEWIDCVTLYYVESAGEWEQITAKYGAMAALKEAQQDGVVRAIGLTTHPRDLGESWARSSLLDLLMVRYNAAHRGAEADVFPTTDKLNLPVVCFTCLRWGALLQPTASDPAEFDSPPASEWYRFVLSNPSVSVALMAPNDRTELLQNLELLDDWNEIDPQRRSQLAAHGDRVREAYGPFP